jgi:hypothetical protein
MLTETILLGDIVTQHVATDPFASSLLLALLLVLLSCKGLGFRV